MMFGTFFIPVFATLQSAALVCAISIYSWGTGLFAMVPDYAVMDAILILWTIWHLFLLCTVASVSDAAYKMTLVHWSKGIVEKINSIPLFAATLMFGLTVQTCCLGYKAWQGGYQDSAITIRAIVSAYTLACTFLLKKLTDASVKLTPQVVLEYETKLEQHGIANWMAPPKWTTLITAPVDFILRPSVTGLENIPRDYSAFYVSNHSLHGVEMGSFLSTVYQKTGVFLRGLGDTVHFGQLHGELLRYFGSVRGTRENVDVLMEHKHNVLVYPGGAHEIMKPSTVPKYTLMWKERLGFARMAIKHGYPIVPCCSVGTEDMVDIMYDIPAGFLRKGMKLPLVAPPMPHRIQRVYFWFGEPIPTAQYNGDWENDDVAREVRDKVQAAVKAGIREMQSKQEQDPNRFLYQHVYNSVANFCNTPFNKASGKTLDDDKNAPGSKKAD